MNLDARLLALLPAQREFILAAAQMDDPDETIGVGDLSQMIDGFIALLTEELSGPQRETRKFFLGTVIPSLMETGVDPYQIIEPVIRFAILVTSSLAQASAPEDRKAATERLASFFGSYVTELTRVALEARA